MSSSSWSKAEAVEVTNNITSRGKYILLDRAPAICFESEFDTCDVTAAEHCWRLHVSPNAKIFRGITKPFYNSDHCCRRFCPGSPGSFLRCWSKQHLEKMTVNPSCPPPRKQRCLWPISLSITLIREGVVKFATLTQFFECCSKSLNLICLIVVNKKL